MEINVLNLRKSINKAYLKVKPNRYQIETFKKNIANLFDQIKESESEEFHKNIISEFLKNTYYSPGNYINTKGRADLVIHNGKNSNSTVGVLFELKKPSNKSEMPTCKNINTKAFQELILYFLIERITHKNIEIKYLVVTNILEWFIFNASDFEKLFASDKNLVKQFEDFENERLSGKITDFFYKCVAEPFVENNESEISVTYFNIKDFETIIKNANKEDDNKLIALYKIFSPEQLLKLPFANDSNNLDKTFYNELLHIIGLEETKKGSKKLIGRKIEKKRNPGSLIENSITILKYEDCLSQVSRLPDFGNDREEQFFNISLELSITWINRILFLKLLEGQLIKYNNGDKSFRFLNIDKINDFDELNKLFFQVLAVKESERSEIVNYKFGNIPFLNSSLFEPSELEHKTIRINSLDDHSELSVLSGTVLKDKTGRKLTGNINPLRYLFEFLDSYDFSSEGSEDIQEENKTLINASVLGLIFEKINGYKDGSFFTPGFITMYMCHEVIRRTVIQKFNEAKGWKCDTIADLYNEIEDIREANRLINSLRICDPAVGSGHFLVSALNEIIAIKSELKILSDIEGKKLKEYTIEVINDELIITDEQSKLYEYNPKSKESQRVQQALFQEKQRIIENCLFGVDINPNSVKICRLRLWIELLKNAYYKPDTKYKELETLPNIDINIKCGNSLISRYPLNTNIKTALKSSKWTVDNYREAIMNYRNAGNKEEKRTLEQLIYKIKNDFATEVSRTNQDVKTLSRYKNELLQLTTQQLFQYDGLKKKEWRGKLESLDSNINKFELKISEIKNNKVFENAFEWRFEFPEVLNNDGDFMGFDAVIGNPPYVFGGNEGIPKIAKEFFKQNFISGSGKINLFTIFIELAFNLLREKGIFSYIVPNTFLRVTSYHESRKLLIQNQRIHNIFDFGNSVFEDAITTSIVIIADKVKVEGKHKILINNKGTPNQIEQGFLADSNFIVSMNSDFNNRKIIQKLNKNSIDLGSICKELIFGVVISKNKDEVVSNIQLEGWKPFLEGKDIGAYFIRPIHSYLNYGSKMLHRARTKEVFEAKEKLLVQRITGGSHPLKVAYDNNQYYNKESINNIILKDNCIYNAKYILALLNSTLINWFYANQFTNESTLTVNLSKKYLSQIPIATGQKNEEENLISLVEKIIENKKLDPNSDSYILESEIDQIVYKLYGLNEDEIGIVKSRK